MSSTFSITNEIKNEQMNQQISKPPYEIASTTLATFFCDQLWPRLYDFYLSS